jgi:hypothetical protein
MTFFPIHQVHLLDEVIAGSIRIWASLETLTIAAILMWLLNTTITVIDRVGRFLEKLYNFGVTCFDWYMAYAHDHVWTALKVLYKIVCVVLWFTAVYSYRFVKYVYTNRREIAARMNEIREQVSVAFTYRITY